MATRKSTPEDCAKCEHDCSKACVNFCMITENKDEPVEKEKNCDSHCPFCNSTNVDWGLSYSVADSWQNQRATCLDCDSCFIETSEVVYRSTLITEEK